MGRLCRLGLSARDLEAAPLQPGVSVHASCARRRNARRSFALKVALAPCIIGYAEIATRLAALPGALAGSNPYRDWIEEHGPLYQAVAAGARAQLDRLGLSPGVTPAREAELCAIFKEATCLEIEFRQMGWRAGLAGE